MGSSSINQKYFHVSRTYGISQYSSMNLPRSWMRQQNAGFFPNQRFGQSSYFCQLLWSQVQVPTLTHAAQQERNSFLFFIRDGPRRQGFSGENLPFDQLSELWGSGLKTSQSSTSQLELNPKIHDWHEDMSLFPGTWKEKKEEFFVLVPLLTLSYFIAKTEVTCCFPFPYFLNKNTERTLLEQGKKKKVEHGSNEVWCPFFP